MSSKEEKIINSIRWADLKPGDLIIKFNELEDINKIELVLFVLSVDDSLNLSKWIEIICLNEMGEIKSNFYRSFFKIKEDGWKLVAWSNY